MEGEGTRIQMGLVERLELEGLGKLGHLGILGLARSTWWAAKLSLGECQTRDVLSCCFKLQEIICWAELFQLSRFALEEVLRLRRGSGCLQLSSPERRVY